MFSFITGVLSVLIRREEKPSKKGKTALSNPTTGLWRITGFSIKDNINYFAVSALLNNNFLLLFSLISKSLTQEIAALQTFVYKPHLCALLLPLPLIFFNNS